VQTGPRSRKPATPWKKKKERAWRVHCLSILARKEQPTPLERDGRDRLLIMFPLGTERRQLSVESMDKVLNARKHCAGIDTLKLRTVLVCILNLRLSTSE
jgi:hypothetical protein